MRFRITLLKSIYFFAIILTIAIACKRSEIPTAPDPTPTNPVGGPVNDAAQVTASVSGIVLDESNAPIADAVVTSGTATTTTNTNGMFIFQNISLSKENGNVTVVKAGYFKGVRSFKTTAGKNHTVRIQLMQRVLSGTVNAAAGGAITSNGGATIVFPANAFVTSTGAAYTGTVNVYSRWIDPTAANLPFVIPGDLRGVSTAGVENILETYGMVGAELTDATGNLLKIATGKTATVSFPIPASLSAAAPASIVLWHFDDATTRWKENGIATKTGSKYTAQVDKFSFWNVDVPNANFIYLDYTLINATTNTPLVSTSTRIKRANGTYGYGITNNAGFVSGLVPNNEALVLEAVSSSVCGTIFYSQNIGPFTSNSSIGNINITLPASQYFTFTGTLIDCSSAPVSNGYVSVLVNGIGGIFTSPNANGVFSASILNCTGNTNVGYNYQGTNYATLMQSTITQGSTTSSAISLGNVSVCGSTQATNVYVAGWTSNLGATLWKNGVPIALSPNNINSNATSVFVTDSDVYVVGNSTGGATLWKNGTPTSLNGSVYAEPTSVFVSGTDVYVTMIEYGGPELAAKVWKNGVATYIPSIFGVNYNTRGYSVFVSGSDVYVAGTEDHVYGTSKARLWKNGVNILGTNSSASAASSVFINNSDVYVVGNIDFNTIQWKNGVSTILESSSSSGANSIFALGTDVYTVSTIDSIYQSQFIKKTTKLWKNGISTILNAPGGNEYIEGKSVYAKDSDVYVTGIMRTNGGNFFSAIIWKNGVPVILNTGTNQGKAFSVFVK